MKQLETVFDELRRLLTEIAIELEAGPIAREQAARPALDVLVDDDVVEIQAEVPGCTVAELEILIAGDLLTLKGRKTVAPPTREGQAHHHRLERTQGTFERKISLPAAVDSSRAAATLENGLLCITLPLLKERRHEQRSVAIQEIEESEA